MQSSKEIQDEIQDQINLKTLLYKIALKKIQNKRESSGQESKTIAEKSKQRLESLNEESNKIDPELSKS